MLRCGAGGCVGRADGAAFVGAGGGAELVEGTGGVNARETAVEGGREKRSSMKWQSARRLATSRPAAERVKRS